MPVNQKVLNPPEDKLQKTYDWIKSKNDKFVVPMEQFRSDMQDPEKLKKTHQWISDNNSKFTVPFEQFAQDMGVGIKKKDDTLPAGYPGPISSPVLPDLSQIPVASAQPHSVPPAQELEAFSEQNDLEKTIEQARAEHQAFVETGATPEIDTTLPKPDIKLGPSPQGLGDIAQNVFNKDQADLKEQLADQHLQQIKFNDALLSIKKETGTTRGDIATEKSNGKIPAIDLALTKQKAADEEAKQKRFLDDVDNGIDPFTHVVGMANKAIVDTFSSIPKTVAILANQLDNALGTEGALGEAVNKKVTDYTTYKVGQWIEDAAEDLGITKGNPKLYNDFWYTTVPSGIGSVAGLVLGGFAGAAESAPLKLLGKQSYVEATRGVLEHIKTPGYVLGGTMMGVPEFEEAKRAGASDDAAFKVFLQNYATGQLQAVVVARALHRLNTATNGALVTRLKNGFNGGVEEYIEETTQQFLTNLTAKEYYDKSRDLLEGVGESGGAGFIVGFLLSAIGGGAGRLPKSEREKVEAYVKAKRANIESVLGPEIARDNITQPLQNENTTTEPVASTPVQPEAPIPVQAEPISAVEPTADIQPIEESVAPAEGKAEIAAVDNEEIQRQIKPIAEGLVDIERQFKNSEYDISTEMDGQTVVTDPEGEIVEPENLPDHLKELAGKYEEAANKLYDFTSDNFGKVMQQTRKEYQGTEAKFEEVKNELPANDKIASEKTPVLSLKEQAIKDINSLIESGDLEKNGAGYKILTPKGASELKRISESLKTPVNESKPAAKPARATVLPERKNQSVEKPSVPTATESGNGPVGEGLPKQETFGKEGRYKVLGVNTEGNKVGEDENGHRAVLQGRIIVGQPVGMVPTKGGYQAQINPSEGEFLTTEEAKTVKKPEPEAPLLKTEEPAKKSDAKKEHIKKLFGELDELIGPGRVNIVGSDDKERKHKIALKGAEIVGAYVDYGITRFQEIARQVYEDHGEPALRKFLDALKAGYGHALATAENIDEFDDIKTIRNYKADDLIKSFQNGHTDSTIPDTNGENTPQLDAGDTTQKSGAVAESGQVKRGTEQSGEPSGGRSGSVDEGGTPGGRSNGSSERNDTSAGDTGGIAGDEQQAEKSDNERPGDVDAQNHVINEGDTIVPTGEIAKIKANIDAIKLVQKLNKENRNATPEEKQTLAKFVGWGGLASVLDERKFASRTWEEAWNKKYGKLHEQISELLSEDEFRAAVNSTINAHYTDSRVIKNLWDLAKHLGFKGGNVLEPSAGVGHFFGLMPQDIAKKSQLKAYELDNISGQILSKLYPEAGVRVTGYENSVEGNNSQDLVISNVPFAQKAPFDKKNKDISKFSLHNYFIAKGIRQLKPGGLGIFITSMSSMDNPGASTKFREWTNDEGNADFIGAIRLPNNAFEENAGTQVTTDILVYRKRTEDQPGEFNQQYRNVVPIKETEDQDGKPVTIDVNEYFAKKPEMMLGDMALAYQVGSGGLYNPNVQTMTAPAEQNTSELIKERINQFPKDIFGAQQNVSGTPSEIAQQGDKEGTLKEKGGKLFLVEGGSLVSQPNETINGNKNKKYFKAEVVKDYTAIKDAVRTLLKAEQGDNTDLEIKSLRDQLNKTYDKFRDKYGDLNNNRRVTFLEDDAESPMVYALENVKKEAVINENGSISKKYSITKSDIFNKRVNFPVKEPVSAENLGDALNISISYRNSIDLPYIASMTGSSVESVKDDLLGAGLAFENPTTGLLETSDSYLSGFVRTKLREAEGAVEDRPEYQKNIDALKEVIPKDIPAQQIEFKLGSTWLPTETINSFVRDTLGVDAGIYYNTTTGSWIVSPGRTYDSKNTVTYASGKFTGLDLVEKALNLRQPEVSYTVKNPDGSTSTIKDAEKTASAQAKMAELADLFYNYVKSNKSFMDKIEKIYNDVYNDYIEKKYSLPSFVHFPNSNTDIKLRIHQRKAVARMLHDSTLLAHQVGTGKTYSIITAAMEMRRLGVAKKPMIVVQNATLEQFAKDFKKLYPGSTILSPSKKEMDSNNRQRLFNKIAYGDWDSIIIPQSFLDFIPDDPDREDGYINEQLDELKAALGSSGDRGTTSEINKAIKGLEGQLEKLEEKRNPKVKDIAKQNLAIEKAVKKQASRRKDQVLTFENMGIDAMFLDEAHAYKKLGFFTKMSRIKGIDTGRSQRAFGAFMKARWIQEKNKGRNVIFATGTPITNTMAEVWTMMKFISPDILNKYKINSFDEFASTFGQVEPSLEFTASGKFKIVERFKSYINAPELLTAFRAKTDVVLTEDIPEFKESNSIPKMKVQPDGKAGFTQNILPQTSGLEKMMGEFKRTLEIWEKLPGKEKRAQSYIPLLVFNRAKQAAIDLRLINPNAQDDPGSKTNAVVKQVKRIYDETSAYNGAQMIFSDMYQSPEAKEKFLDDEGQIPNPSFGVPRFNLYQDIKKKLVELGIPENQIAIIHDFEGEVKRPALFERVNNGEVRILLGTSEKMGVGVNAQERLAALHHIDAPPRPMDFEQRNGRIIRQGNLHAEMNKPVEIPTYGVEKTLDATAYQRLSIKQKFINQMMKAEGVDRNMVDDADEDSATDMTFDQMMSTLSGSQHAILHTQKMYELRKLRTAELNHKRNQVEFNSQIRNNENKIRAYKNMEEKYRPVQKEYTEEFPDKKIESVTINGVKTDQSKDTPIGPLLQKYMDQKIGELDKTGKTDIESHIFLNNGVPVKLVFQRRFQIKTNAYRDYVKYTLLSKVNKDAEVNEKTVESGQGLITSMNAMIENFITEGQITNTFINGMDKRIEKVQSDNEAFAKLLEKPFDKTDKLKALEADVKDLEEKMKAENSEVPQPANTEAMPQVDEDEDHSGEYEGEQASTKKIYQPPIGSPKKSRKITRLPVSPIYGADPKLLKDIIVDLSKAIPQKIFQTRVPKRRAFGLYNPKNAAISIRYHGDLDAAAHELGHGLDDVLDLVGKMTPAAEKELIKLSRFGSNVPKGASSSYKVNEGVAEYVRAWLVNPDDAIKDFPETSQIFLATVPLETQAKLRAFGDDIRKHAGLSAHDQISANVQMEPEKSVGVFDKLFPSKHPENFELTWMDRLGTKWTNSLLPYERGVQFLLDKQDIETLEPSKDPRILARLLAGANDKISDVIKNGFVDPQTPVSVVGKDEIRINRIIDPVSKQPMNFEWLISPLDSSSEQSIKDEQKEVITYMIAQRTLELEGKLDRSDFLTGIGAGIFQDITVAKKRLEDHDNMPDEKRARIEEAARRYREYAQKGLEYAVANGRLSQVSLNEINAANLQYVALNRTGGEDEVVGFTKDNRALGAVKEIVHKVKGSTKTIENPYQSLLDNTIKTIKESDRNNALMAFEELFTAARVMHQGDPEYTGSVATEVSGPQAGKPIQAIFKNGKKHYYLLDDDVYKAVKNITDNKALPFWATAVAKLTRWGIINFPTFAVRNRIRDIGSRLVISDTKPLKGLDIYLDKTLKRENINSMKHFGGGQAGYYMMAGDLYQQTLNETVRELAVDKKNILTSPGLMMEKTAGWYNKVISSGETATRAEEYRSAFRFAKSKGLDDTNSAIYAAIKARDLLDFAVAGEYMKAINQVIPFTNAAVQGLRKAMKSAASDPAGFTVRWFLYSLIPALFTRMLAHWNDKDKEYADMPNYRRDLFYNLPIGDSWLTIPKPFELGVLASSGDRLLGYYLYNEKDAMDGYAGSLARSFSPIDDAAFAGPFKTPVEILANYDFFRNKHIIPTEEEGLEMKLRRTESASRLGQAISKVLGESIDPRNVDYAIKSSTGYFGDMTLRASDIGRDDTRHPMDMTATGFVKNDPVYDGKAVQELLESVKKYGIPHNHKALMYMNFLLADYFKQKDPTLKAKAGEAVRKWAETANAILGGETNVENIEMKNHIKKEVMK